MSVDNFLPLRLIDLSDAQSSGNRRCIAYLDDGKRCESLISKRHLKAAARLRVDYDEDDEHDEDEIDSYLTELADHYLCSKAGHKTKENACAAVQQWIQTATLANSQVDVPINAEEDHVYRFVLSAQAEKALGDTTYIDRNLRGILNNCQQPTNNSKGFIYIITLPAAPGFSRIRHSKNGSGPLRYKKCYPGSKLHRCLPVQCPAFVEKLVLNELADRSRAHRCKESRCKVTTHTKWIEAGAQRVEESVRAWTELVMVGYVDGFHTVLLKVDSVPAPVPPPTIPPRPPLMDEEPSETSVLSSANTTFSEAPRPITPYTPPEIRDEPVTLPENSTTETHEHATSRPHFKEWAKGKYNEIIKPPTPKKPGNSEGKRASEAFEFVKGLVKTAQGCTPSTTLYFALFNIPEGPRYVESCFPPDTTLTDCTPEPTDSAVLEFYLADINQIRYWSPGTQCPRIGNLSERGNIYGWEPSGNNECVTRGNTNTRPQPLLLLLTRGARNFKRLRTILRYSYLSNYFDDCDDLSLDPEYPPQSFQEWYDEEERNPVTPRRKTIYILAPPEIGRGVEFVESWSQPQIEIGEIPTPEIEDVINYLKAFFHGLPVKRLHIPNWGFTPWTEEPSTTKPPSKRPRNQKQKQKKPPSFISLTTSTESIRIRIRPTPDGDKLYSHQLNLDDLLDAAISILPKDAYALCMLVNQDLYEDDDDLFICGRAYGGSRVAVVSAARYHPALDGEQGVERGHVWPGSHCSSYVEKVCWTADADEGRRKKAKTLPSNPGAEAADANDKRDGPLETALAIFSTHPPSPPPSNSPTQLQTNPKEESLLWLSRLARTTSHELCHCLGLDHCVYYACVMQGSASLSEDTRQPPYLCPVDLAKLLCATGSGVEERERALLEFCEDERVREGGGFRALAGWLRGSLGLNSYDE
ncbi:hypothetical protein BDV12DRAFT_199700 [Aspergillus spectabilis]